MRATPAPSWRRRTIPRQLSDLQSILLCGTTAPSSSRISRRRWPPTMPILPTALSIWRGRKTFRRQRRIVGTGTRCRRGGEFDVAFCQGLRHRACHRQRRRCREHVGHGGRRSVRVRRHQGRGARRQASGDGRGYRSAGAGTCGGRPCGDGGDLCLGRRRGAGARRADAGQGCPQGRAAGRGADAMGRPLRARYRRYADAGERG